MSHCQLGPYCFEVRTGWVVEEGSKKVPLAGVDDKITAVFDATLEGHFLPPQIIYQSKTEACMIFKRLACYLYPKSLGK